MNYLKKHKRPYDCREVPADKAHLRHLLSILRLYGFHSREEIFHHPCPTCREPVILPPTESLSLNNVISGIADAIDAAPSARDKANEQGVTTVGYFDGLFLNR